MEKFFLCMAFFLIAVAVGCGKAEGGKAVSARAAAADFHLTDLAGKPVSLSALKGKVVLLNFWTTWCPPCRAELPSFVELYRQYQGQGLEIVGISLDQGPASEVASFAAENHLNYPIAIGDQSLTQAYGGIRGIPTTFLIDRQGRIAEKWIGAREKEVFEEAIQKLLAE